MIDLSEVLTAADRPRDDDHWIYRPEERLRDLSIALAAGAAGIYSVVRKDLSSVDVVVAGPTRPPGLDTLRSTVATDAYPSPALEVEWVESSPLLVPD